MNKVFSMDEINRISIPIAKKHGVAKLYIFGSYARKEATEKSDIDLFVDKGDVRNLLDYFALVSDLVMLAVCASFRLGNWSDSYQMT